MKYDDASWHYCGDFPDDLPPSAGATHIGMFLAWSLLTGLSGELHTEELPDELSKLRNRQVTPSEYFISDLAPISISAVGPWFQNNLKAELGDDMGTAADVSE